MGGVQAAGRPQRLWSVITHFVVEATPRPQSRGPPSRRGGPPRTPIRRGRRLSYDATQAIEQDMWSAPNATTRKGGKTLPPFSGIAPSTQYVQLAPAIAQQVQQMSDVFLDLRRKAPSRRTRRRACGILRSADSFAFQTVQIPIPCFGRSIEIQLKLKRMFDFHNAAFSKILGCVIHATDV
jgi:hypothetical protein